MTEHKTPALAWRLAVVMAEREIRTTRALRKRLSGVGVEISEAQLGRIVKKLPQMLSTELIAGLCSVLQVAPGELLTIPGFRAQTKSNAQAMDYPATEATQPAPTAETTPKVLPRTSTGRPQATAISRPKY